LSEKQKEVIENYKPNILSTIELYIKAKVTTHWLPNIGPFIRRYTQDMQSAYEEILLSNDPSFYIKKLCELLVALKGGDDSLTKITTILGNLFSILLIASKPYEQVLKNT
jgi:hypothetical protein